MEHLTTETIEKFIRGEYPFPQLMEISAHLLNCPQKICQEKLNQADPNFLKEAAKVENARTKVINEGNHFSDGEIESYVTRKFDLGKRRSMSSHFTSCPLCAIKLKTLDPDYLSNFIKDKLNRNDSPETVIKSQESKYNFRVLVPLATFSVLLIVFLITLLMLPNNQTIDQVKMEEVSSPNPANQLQNNADANKNSANAETGNKRTTEVLSNSNIEQRNTNADSKLGVQSKTTNVPTLTKLPKKDKIVNRQIIVKDRSLNKNCDSNPLLAVSPKDEIITDTQPNLTWKPIVGSTSYKIYVSDTNNNLIEELNVSDAQKTSCKLTKQLELNKRYEWKVVVTLEGGKEVYSESAYFSVGKKAKKLSRSKEKSRINEVRCLKSQN